MKIETKVTVEINKQKIVLTEQEAKDLRDELQRIFQSTAKIAPWYGTSTGSGTITLYDSTGTK